MMVILADSFGSPSREMKYATDQPPVPDNDVFIKYLASFSHSCHHPDPAENSKRSQ
jgi:hypothetical protein